MGHAKYMTNHLQSVKMVIFLNNLFKIVNIFTTATLDLQLYSPNGLSIIQMGYLLPGAIWVITTQNCEQRVL